LSIVSAKNGYGKDLALDFWTLSFAESSSPDIADTINYGRDPEGLTSDYYHGILSICISFYEVSMTRVTVSSKYQIVIPLDIRRALNIRKGQTLSMVNMGGVIELVPSRDIREMRGAFPQVTLDEIRDESDRT